MRHPYRPKRRTPKGRDPSTSRYPHRTNEGRQEQDERLIDNAIAGLMEHFDTVQVVVTRLANDGTIHAARGRGNWYARVGSVREWLVGDDEDTRVRRRPDDGGEDFAC